MITFDIKTGEFKDLEELDKQAKEELRGEKGDKGDTGEQGLKGDKGDKGDAGEQGLKGDKGERGEKGDTGENGKDGRDGVDGKDGKDGKDGQVIYSAQSGGGRMRLKDLEGMLEAGNDISLTTANKKIVIASTGGGAVDSVNGQTGVVVLDTGDIADVVDSRYVTDAQLVVIGNTSGTNTGDQTSIVGITGTKAQFDTACTDGNFLYVGDVTQYTDEMAQDAVGAMVTDGSLVYVDATPLLTRGALTGDITAAQGSNATTLATVNANVGSFGSATAVGTFTVNAKGLITAAGNTTVTPAASSITSPQALTRTNDTNVTLTLGGTPTTALLQATSITVGWSGTLAETRGGTNQSTYAQGDILYASAANTLSKLAKDTNATRYLSNTGASNNPAWAQINLANGVTGDLPLANLAPSSSASRLLGRGDASAGDWQEISIDSTLTMLGTTLGVTVTTPFVMQTDGSSFTTNALYRAVDSTGTTAKPTDIIVDNSENISGIGSLQLVSGGALRTGTSAGNTVLLQAYDVDGAAYTTFGTLTANNSPTLNFENTTIGITAPAQGNFGNSTNYASFSSGGNLVFNGTAQYLLNLDQFAFAVNGLPTTGIKFRFFTGVAGYAFTDLAGADIASIDVSGTDSIVNAVYGYAHGVASPASIGSNQNDYAGFAGAGFGRLSSSANYNITGVVAPTNSRPQFKFGCNTGNETINLTSNDTGSTAANRFALANDDTINVYPGEMFIEQYDTTSLKWRAGKLSNITRGHVNALATATYIV